MSLKDTPLGTPEEFNVVVEIPKGSPNKYQYHEEKDEIYVDFVFENGLTFIKNYGFIPQTLSGDGDTLDVMVLGDEPIKSGTVVTCRAIGMIEQLDRGEVDNKILAVLKDDHSINSIKDLSQAELQSLRDFYAEVARQKKKVIEILGFHDKDRAMEEIKKAMI